MIIPVDLGLKTHSLFGCALIFTLFFGVIRLQLYLASTSKLALASETASHPGGGGVLLGILGGGGCAARFSKS